MTDAHSHQVQAVQQVIAKVLGEAVEGVYLYGSAVAGGLKPASDLDLFVALSRPTRRDERAALVHRLTPLSRRDQRPEDWRPLEVTVVASSDMNPWRYPPRTDFQYGEWLRARFDAGDVDPEKPLNPDLAILLAHVRESGRALNGPPPTELLPEIPRADLTTALAEVVPDLLGDVATDTANVLLTLARVWHTLVTGTFTSKDAAADWALARLAADYQPPLRKARDVYSGDAVDDWTGLESEARQTANRLGREIELAADQTGTVGATG